MELINETLIDFELNALTKEAAIKQLSKKINNAGRLNNLSEFYNSVIEREKLTSTGIGFGIAIPHGKSESVNEPTVAIGISKGGIDWESIDGKPVEIVILIAVPESSAGDLHLKILANLSRALMHEEFRSELINCNDKTKIIDMFNDII